MLIAGAKSPLIPPYEGGRLEGERKKRYQAETPDARREIRRAEKASFYLSSYGFDFSALTFELNF